MKTAPKFALISASFFLGISAMLTYFIYSSSIEVIEKNTINDLENRALQTIDKIDRLMHENVTATKVMASDPILSSRASSPEQISDRLIEFRNLFKSYISISFYDTGRISIADTAGLEVGEQREFTDYWPAIARGNANVLYVGHSKIISRTVIYFASVVKDGTGNPLGAVVARFPIEKLNEILGSAAGNTADLRTEETLDVDLLDEDGGLIFSTDRRVPTKSEKMHDVEIILAHIGAGKKSKTFRLPVMDNGRPIETIFSTIREQGFKDFSGNNWTLILHLPVKTAFASAARLRGRVVVILLISGLIGIGIVGFLSYLTTLPLRQLAGAAREIGRGNFEITVDVATKDELGELAAIFNKMVVDLKESREHIETINAELNDFAYVVSHDLKAPLRAITSLATWLDADYGEKLGEQGRESLQLLVQRTKRMNSLIEGILEYSRLGRVRQEEMPVDLEAVVQEAIDLIAPPDHVTVKIETKLPTMVFDKIRIYQVFQNLIGNAVKYLDKPRGEIRVGCHDEGGIYTFYVADNGQGIEEKYFSKVFELFQTLKARDEVEGTGVGLTIVKKIVKMNGGRIWLESKVGEGTTFWFTLPHVVEGGGGRGWRPNRGATQRGHPTDHATLGPCKRLTV